MALQTKTITCNGSNGHHAFTLTVTENSTSTSNNTSSVSFNFKLSSVKTGYDWNYSNNVPVTYLLWSSFFVTFVAKKFIGLLLG
ncbi:hypothetical protein [Bariatricus sp. HCP28S3_E2]|uniref:hypothetical protein n=1 Tax=Bariatricus sp. HCP28S3_E2 TaxID=3438902 RepID=UPI003F89C51C